MDVEAAETYLRLMAEAELRRAVHVPGVALWEPIERIRFVASALAAMGADGEALGQAVAADLGAALAFRFPDPAGPLSLPKRPVSPARRVVRSVPMLRSGMAAQNAPPDGGEPPQVIPAGSMLMLSDGGPVTDLWLLNIIRTSWYTLVTVAARRQEGSPDLPFVPFWHHLRYVSAVDDRGRLHRVHYTGDATDENAINGWLSVHPALARDASWLEFRSGTDQPPLRIPLTPVAPAHPDVAPAEPVSRAERLLDGIAGQLFGGIAGELLGEPSWPLPAVQTAQALQAVGALPPDSQAAARLAALCQYAGDLFPGDAPPAGLPGPWTSVLAWSGRRHKPPVKQGTAPLTVSLPRLDGVTFTLAGVRSWDSQTLLSLVAQGLPADDWGQPDGLRWIQWFPWWIRDSAGQWHVAAPDGYGQGGQDLALLHAPVVPPLARSVTWLEVTVPSPSARLTVTVPLRWLP